MRIPKIRGFIDRRILINYTIEPSVARNIIPAPFRPKLYEGYAMGGICLIRLKSIRPKGLPQSLGIASENGAHRFAVEWDENGIVKEGVYIPRRDTSSAINALMGGRLFPGRHYHAKFNVSETGTNYSVGFRSSDAAFVAIKAISTKVFNPQSVFKTLTNASAFFEGGCTGYSPNGKNFDGVTLHTYHWKVTPLEILNIRSSYFEDKNLFPDG